MHRHTGADHAAPAKPSGPPAAESGLAPGVTGPSALSRGGEWAAHWPIPLVAMLGIAACSTFTYTNGVFLRELTRAFGWTRSQYASAFTLQMLLSLLAIPLAGRLVDRFGPRRVALAGIATFVAGFSSLALANGSVWQWRLLCLAQGAGAACITPPVWIAAIVTRFHASRGMALAVALAGVGVASTLWPVLSAAYIAALGWRATYPALALTAAAVLLPPTALFFPDAAAHAVGPATDAPPSAPAGGVTRALGERAMTFLVVAGGLYSTVSVGLTVSLVPILEAKGFDLASAAWLAGIAGFATLTGRVLTGYLLDRYSARAIGLIAFFNLVIVSLLLVFVIRTAFAALPTVLLLGLSTGAETDVMTYIASRRLDRRIFASAYAVIVSVFAVCASLGPLLANALYDARGSYDPYLLSIVPTVVTAAILLWQVPARR